MVMSCEGSDFTIADNQLSVRGNCILKDIHDNIFLTSSSTNLGSFIGVEADHYGSHLVFPVGKIRGLSFLSLYRFKYCWMTHCMGKSGKEIPCETQFLMVEVPNSSSNQSVEDGEGESKSGYYVVFLPILEGDFRAVLQGNANDELEICLENGDSCVQEFDGRRLVYVAAGIDPYTLMENSVKSLESELKTFRHRDNKEMPDMLNWFGWCTWDAFYTDVTAEGVKQGLKSLREGGTPPKFVIIDDGWQCVSTELKINDDTTSHPNRLTSIKENQKFQSSINSADKATGFHHFISEIKNQFSLKYVYIWHAIMGYWDGVEPDNVETAKYESKVVSVIPSPGLLSNGICEGLKGIVKNKVGLVNPEKAQTFYNDLHSYLASNGVDGVKVDGQSILDMLGEGFGGRVKLARKFHQALEESISKNFRNNEVISCMSHHTDALYSTKNAAVIRASDDFFPRDSASHTIHIASVAYNTIFLGEFMQPDWDMFHSLHPMAEYHGAARAVGGCPIYVSDKPGNHDFDVLKKLVLPDGSTLRAKLHGRPTKDCLFSDPTKDRESLLKFWNMNEFTGILGVFNCQGASWCRDTIKNIIHDEQPLTISGVITPNVDVHNLHTIADQSSWTGDCVLYSHKRGEICCVQKGRTLPIEIKARDYELFTVVPLKKLSNGALFAPIGLIDMFNSGGAIKELTYESNQIKIKVRGCGFFGAYSSVGPKSILVDANECEYEYCDDNGLVKLHLSVPMEELYSWSLTIEL